MILCKTFEKTGRIVKARQLLTLSLSPDLNIGVTWAISRQSENFPYWIEILKTWSMIFFKLSYASIVMLLFKSSNHAALFRFKRLYASSNSLKFSSSHCIFSLWDVKKSWSFYAVLGIVFANFDPTEVRNLLNPLAFVAFV